LVGAEGFNAKSPERRRQAVEGIRGKYGLSERLACWIASQPRGTQGYTTIVRADEDALTQAIIALALQYGRYGYRRIKSLLDEAGWGCRLRSRAADLAPREAESTYKTNAARQALAQRRILHPSETGAAQSCVEL
jgi:hypothetical protein